jgi:hypothetical protein
MNSQNIIKTTAKASFYIQIITATLDILALNINLEEKDNVLKQLLKLELMVQFIEGGFYFWLINSFDNINNITKFRYHDWMFSTPTMLVSFVVYLIYLRNVEEKKDEILDFWQLINKHKNILIQIVILNELMLLFGYLSEIGKLSNVKAVILGFIPFYMMFRIIYDNFAKYTTNGMMLFKYFVGIWALYGIAALTTYNIKNTSYNILDLFAKNILGLYYAYVVWINKKNK